MCMENRANEENYTIINFRGKGLYKKENISVIYYIT